MVSFKKLGLSNTKRMFEIALERKFAIPGYNFSNLEQLQAIIIGCGEINSPVVLQNSPAAGEYANRTMISYLCNYAVMAIFSNSIESLLNKVALGRLRAPLVVLIAARTKREFDYKQNAMDFFLKKLNLKNIIGTLYNPDPIFYAEALRSNLGLHCFLATGSMQSAEGGADTASVCLRSATMNVPLKKN